MPVAGPSSLQPQALGTTTLSNPARKARTQTQPIQPGVELVHPLGENLQGKDPVITVITFWHLRLWETASLAKEGKSTLDSRRFSAMSEGFLLWAIYGLNRSRFDLQSR